MSKKRTFAIVFISGFFSAFAFPLLEGGSWPSFSLLGFIVFVSGLAVISLVLIGLESMYEARRDRS